MQREYHTLAKDKDVMMYLNIVNDSDTLLGVIDIKELLQADPGDKTARYHGL